MLRIWFPAQIVRAALYFALGVEEQFEQVLRHCRTIYMIDPQRNLRPQSFDAILRDRIVPIGCEAHLNHRKQVPIRFDLPRTFGYTTLLVGKPWETGTAFLCFHGDIASQRLILRMEERKLLTPSQY